MSLAVEETTSQEQLQAQQFAPGELDSFDYSDQPFVTLTEEEKNEVREICRNCAKRDIAARRMEVEQAWEARLFKRGYQYLFPRRGGGWQLTSPVLNNRSWSQMQGAQLYETNIYGAHCDILTSALVRDIPECRFEPFNPNYGPDITTAEKAKDFKDIFSRNNDLRSIHTQAADYMCTDGRVLFYTRTVLDGQRYGFEDPEDDEPVDPEDETTGPPQSPNIEEGQEEVIEENDSPDEEQPEGEEAVQTSTRKPRAREVVEVFGKLEHKLPINVQDIHEADFVQLFRDMFVARAKARHPWIAKKIQPGTGGIGEIGIDHIARLNVALALEGGYVTGDTYNKECTEVYTWLRPSAFMECKDDAVRASLFKQFPDGMLACFVGEVFSFARNEGMDDHLHVLQAFPGTGQNRIALMTKVLSVQKRLNNWIDLLNDYFIKCVPYRWFDANVFGEELRNQTNVPGGFGFFQGQPGRPVTELAWVEPTPTPQPSMTEFIQFFFTDYPQMLSGALPSLFGAESNTDTASGITIQRDQALGRLASPWGALQLASASYFRQAVICAAKCREKLGQSVISESLPDKGTVTVQVAELKGNILSFPEEDSNFPETWIQKRTTFQQLMTEFGAGNPFAVKLLSDPENMRVAKDYAGLNDLDVAEADSIDKQIGEFEILLKTGPQPNPQVAEIKKTMLESAAMAEKEGPEAMQQFEQMAAQLKQQAQSLPPLVSTVPVAQDKSEDHSTEAGRCFKWMNSAEGRKFKNGTPEQKAAYANVHLHWNEHMEMAQKLAPPQATKPTSDSISMAVDKMPPTLAAQAAQKFYGLNASPQDFQIQDATETEQKITEKAADFGHGISGA